MWSRIAEQPRTMGAPQHVPDSLPGPLWLLLVALLLSAGGRCVPAFGPTSPCTVDLCAMGSERAGTGGPDMHGADLTDARLAGARLCGADLKAAPFCAVPALRARPTLIELT